MQLRLAKKRLIQVYILGPVTTLILLPIFPLNTPIFPSNGLIYPLVPFILQEAGGLFQNRFPLLTFLMLCLSSAARPAPCSLLSLPIPYFPHRSVFSFSFRSGSSV